jgi:hypothetical protein
VKFYVFGGNSRSNASIAINSGNQTFSAGSNVVVDVSTEAIILVQPRDYRFTGVNFKFSYAVIGEIYPWYESYIIGPDGYTYFIVGVSVGGVIALILLIVVILCIIKCVRSCNNKKVTPLPMTS